MKITFYLSLSILLLSMLGLQHAKAQTEYTWDDYGLKFSVPAGFQETANDGEHFEGKSDRAKILLFGLYPIKDGSITKSNLKETVSMMAKEANMIMDPDGVADISFNGFQGAYAEGTINGVPAFFACMLDPTGDLNFIVSILHDNVDGAVALLKSIKKK